MKRLNPFTDWMIRLKHAFIAIGYSTNNNLKLDRKDFKPFYDQGLSPIETALTDLDEGGE